MSALTLLLLAASTACGPGAEPEAEPILVIDTGPDDENADVGFPRADGGEPSEICPAQREACQDLGELECAPGEVPSRDECGCACVPWCDQVLGGPTRDVPFPLALSELHADARMFAPHGDVDVDQALAGALAGDDADVIPTYAASFESICATEAGGPLGGAEVDTAEGLVWVKPGEGALDLDPGDSPVVIDLRELPAGLSAREVLDEVTRRVLTEPLRVLEWRVRVHSGSVDEYWSPQSIYTRSFQSHPGHQWPGEAAASRPLAVVVGSKLSSEAARLALSLRLSGAAHLVGSAVPAAVAESRWIGTKSDGALVRVGELSWQSEVLADAVLPDGDIEDLEHLLGEEPGPARLTTVQRPLLDEIEGFGEKGAGAADTATVRAGLVIAHGVVSRLYPYWEEVGTDPDPRLLEAWDLAADLETSDRAAARDVLRRFQEVIRDGHGWVIDGKHTAGSLPLFLDVLDGVVTVRRSDAPDVRVGDVVLARDGESMDEWLPAQLAMACGATDEFRAHVAARELIVASGPTELSLRAPDGTQRTVIVDPVYRGTPALVQSDLGSSRGHGWLDDLGAADVMYVNADGRVAGSDSALNEALEQAEGQAARGLIVDMRGHPAAGGATYDPYSLLQRLIPASFQTPDYAIPVVNPFDPRTWNDTVYEATFDPLAGPSYHGPIVLLLAPWAVSFAEDFSIMLRQADRVVVMGRTSAGTTGSITGLQLPGDFVFTLTGMRAAYQTGDPFHGVGVTPDMRVLPLASDLAAGRDTVLQEAVEYLSTLP